MLKRFERFIGGAFFLLLCACAGPVTRVQARCASDDLVVVVVKLEDGTCEAYTCHKGQDCAWISSGLNACNGWIE